MEQTFMLLEAASEHELEKKKIELERKRLQLEEQHLYAPSLPKSRLHTRAHYT